MVNPKQTDPDLVSLESSLSAIENEYKFRDAKYGIHPSWVYYYLCFLGLVFVMMILGIINTTHVPEPQLVTIFDSNRSKKAMVAKIEPAVETEKKPEFKSSDPWNYSSFTPEQLQKISNQLTSNPSSEFNIVRAEVYSLLGFYDNWTKLKKDGLNFALLHQKANPQDPKANRTAALAFLLNDQTDKAKNLIALATGKIDDSLTEWVSIYTTIKSGKNSLAEMEGLRKKDPTFYPASFVLIQEYLRQNQLPQAREIIEYWRAKSISNLTFVHYAADLLDRQQQYVELLYYLNSFEKLYPKDWTILFYLAKGNLKMQKKDLAKTYFDRILNSQENYLVDQIGKTYFEKGKMSLFDNDYKTAIKELLQASQRMPNDNNIKFYLASAYYKEEDYESAIDVYKQMLSKDQYDPKIRIYLGMAYFEVAQYKLAEKNLLLIYNQGFTDQLLLYYLAKVEEQKGNIAKADEYLQKILAEDPKHAQARKMHENLKNRPAPAPVAPATQ